MKKSGPIMNRIRTPREKLITIGESKPDTHFDPADLAAWTMVASTILNMDEAVTKN